MAVYDKTSFTKIFSRKGFLCTLVGSKNVKLSRETLFPQKK
jgi:hypothetical protein